MKKKALIFLLFFMLLGAMSSAAMAEEAFFSHDGYSVYLTGYRIYKFEHTDADMNIIPPIVGVPAFFLCHLGPISFMY